MKKMMKNHKREEEKCEKKEGKTNFPVNLHSHE